MSNQEEVKTPAAPKVGQLTTVNGIRCRITKVYSYGTIDVLSLDGKQAYRLTGLFY